MGRNVLLTILHFEKKYGEGSFDELERKLNSGMRQGDIAKTFHYKDVHGEEKSINEGQLSCLISDAFDCFFIRKSEIRDALTQREAVRRQRFDEVRRGHDKIISLTGSGGKIKG